MILNWGRRGNGIVDGKVREGFCFCNLCISLFSDVSDLTYTKSKYIYTLPMSGFVSHNYHLLIWPFLYVSSTDRKHTTCATGPRDFFGECMYTSCYLF